MSTSSKDEVPETLHHTSSGPPPSSTTGNYSDEKRPYVTRRSSATSSRVIKRKVENIELARAQHKQKPSPWTKSMFKLYLCLLVPLAASCANGYTGTVMGNANKSIPFKQYFGYDLENGVDSLNIVNSMQQLGMIAGAVFVGPASDIKGRRWGMFIGAVILFIFTIVQATAQSEAQFKAARFFNGIGNIISYASAIVYTSEIMHPSYRGPLTALLNTGWQIGGVISTYIPGGQPWSWRVPFWCQLFFPAVIICAAPFIPETPRWLIANNQHEEALRVMTKYHGDGSVDSPIVQLEYKEMDEGIGSADADKRWWDFRSFWNTREARYRTLLVVTWAFIGQWAGHVEEINHHSESLVAAGIESKHGQLVLSSIYILVGFVAAIIGAIATDKIGRRRQLIIATVCIAVIFVIVTPIDATNISTDAETGEYVAISAGKSKAIIAFQFIEGIIFGLSYTPLQVLYPVECLRYESRAKGIGMYSAFENVAGFYNYFVTPIAVERAQWKYNLAYLFWNILTAGFMYIFYVETRNRTLEELTEIFQSQFPVRTSLTRGNIVIQDDLIIYYEDDRPVD